MIITLSHLSKAEFSEEDSSVKNNFKLETSFQIGNKTTHLFWQTVRSEQMHSIAGLSKVETITNHPFPKRQHQAPTKFISITSNWLLIILYKKGLNVEIKVSFASCNPSPISNQLFSVEDYLYLKANQRIIRMFCP